MHLTLLSPIKAMWRSWQSIVYSRLWKFTIVHDISFVPGSANWAVHFLALALASWLLNARLSARRYGTVTLRIIGSQFSKSMTDYIMCLNFQQQQLVIQTWYRYTYWFFLFSIGRANVPESWKAKWSPEVLLERVTVEIFISSVFFIKLVTDYDYHDFQQQYSFSHIWGIDASIDSFFSPLARLFLLWIGNE